MAKDPIRPTDEEARKRARRLIETARYGSLAVLLDDAPMVTRIAIATDLDGNPLTLVSDLSLHTKALRQTERASLLLGEPGEKGDPLTHPRITLQVRATFLEKTRALKDHYLSQHPKSKLYIDFADFHFVHFRSQHAYLNGGFGQAFHLSEDDLKS